MVLTYATEHGRFLIRPDQHDGSIVSLMFQPLQGQQIRIGLFRSIQDALTAVLQQETGMDSWDSLDPEAIPAKIHDISQWQFEESEELG